jgi:hypothetical protein
MISLFRLFLQSGYYTEVAGTMHRRPWETHRSGLYTGRSRARDR